GVHQGICFSAERAHEAEQAEHGIDDVNALVGWDTPEVYSSQLSEFVLEAGLRVFERYQPALMYLSLTDYVQHKHAPGTVESDRFHQRLDQYFGAFDARGAVVGITADHGMNDKNNALGQPQIIYLSQLLSTWCGAEKARVILPITDPYVVHHGALGSFATVYLPAEASVEDAIERLERLPGMEAVLDRKEACRRFELPEDRIGDVVVVSERHTRSEEHTSE